MSVNNMLPEVEFISGTFLSIIHLFLILFSSSLATLYFLNKNQLPHQISCLIAIAFWIPGFLFYLLIALGLFNPLFSTLSLALLTAIAMYIGKVDKPPLLLFVQFREELVIFWRQISLYSKLLASIAGALLLFRLSRGLIAPPLAWDALTYHLVKAGRWVQAERWVWDDAPDAWQFYQWFPPLGDAYWSWAMLGSHSDTWLSLTGTLILLACGLSTFSTAKALGASVESSWLSGLAAITVPASMAFVTAYYVDSMAMALVMSSMALTLFGIKSNDPKLAGAAVVAAALSAGVKMVLFPYFLVAAVAWSALLVLTFRHRNLFPIISITLIASCVALSWQIFLIFEGKHPLYPAGLSIAGISIFSGQPEFETYHYARKKTLPYNWELPKSLWNFLFDPGNNTSVHLNLTWLFPLVLLAGTVSVVKCCYKETRLYRYTLLAFYLCGATLFAQFWIPSTAKYRDVWASSMGRFFLSWYGLLIAAMSTSHRTWIRFSIPAVILCNLVYSWPRDWTILDWVACGIGACIFVVGTVIVWCLVRSGSYLVRCVSVLLLSFVVLVVGETRSSFRYRFYTSTEHVNEVGYLTKRFAGEAAQVLDTDKSYVINYTADYTGAAYYWFRYPFLGSRLQNRVIYVSPTVDEKPWSKSITTEKPVDYNVWLQRLKNAEVDYVVTAKPFPIEHNWIAAEKQHFVTTHQRSNLWKVIKFSP